MLSYLIEYNFNYRAHVSSPGHNGGNSVTSPWGPRARTRPQHMCQMDKWMGVTEREGGLHKIWGTCSLHILGPKQILCVIPWSRLKK